jgi:hypothetical protein
MGKQPGTSVYVSYKHDGQSKAVVEQLQAACESRGIELRRDTTSIGYKGSIRQYMDELGAGGCVIVVLSDAYLESQYCMYELLEVEKNREFHDRVFPVVLRGTAIHRPVDRVKFIKHWEHEVKALNPAIRDIETGAHLQNLHEDLDLYADIRRAIDGLMGILADMNTLTEDVHRATDFEALLEQVEARLGRRTHPAAVDPRCRPGSMPSGS